MPDDFSNRDIEIESSDLRHRVLFVASILAVVYGVWFAIDNYQTIFYLAVIDLVVAVIFFFIGYFSYRRSKSLYPSYAAIITTCAFFFTIYLFGGTEGTGAVWSFIVPLIVFFLGGFRTGLAISILYMFLCALAAIYNVAFPGIFFVYPPEVLKRFFGVFAFATIIAAGNEYHKLRNEQKLLYLLKTAQSATEKIASSELKYRTLFDSSANAIVIADLELAQILEVNPACCSMFGYQPSELSGESIEILNPGDELIEPLFRKNTETPFSQMSQLPCQRKDRSIFYADMHTALISLAGRRCVVCVFADVTRRVLAERELIAARSRADVANEAKSAFLANMSQDIRTPIQGISGMVEVLLQSQLTNEQKQCAEIVRDSSSSLLALVNDILDITRLESGKMTVESVDFDLLLLAREVFEPFSYRATQKGLACNLYLNGNLPAFVSGDSKKIRQIITNLLDNAIKFTVHGEVIVNVLPDPKFAGKEQILFEINDSGIGISDEKISTLFQSFNQADATSARKYGGTGLGLSISKKLANLMGGEIGVKSKLGQGSQFWFSIPLPYVSGKIAVQSNINHYPSSDRLPAASPAGEPQNQYRALLAEDSPVNQFVVKAMLNKINISVDVVSNGHEAILALANRKYDILLLDLQMPLLDGFETIRLIRNNVKGNFDRSIPVVAVTADAFQETREACLKAGINDCLIKPFKMHELNQIVKKWLVDKG